MARCWVGVVPTSQKVGQHWPSVCWALLYECLLGFVVQKLPLDEIVYIFCRFTVIKSQITAQNISQDVLI